MNPGEAFDNASEDEMTRLFQDVARRRYGPSRDMEDQSMNSGEAFKEEASKDEDEVTRKFRERETPDVVNRDNEWLHPWGPIGRVDAVNGRGAAEVPEFVPTRHELIQLAKYWVGVYFDHAFENFLYGGSSSSAIRLKPFALRRIDRVFECCGDDDDYVTQACKEAEDAFAQTVDAEAWQMFRHGTADEQAAFHEKMEREAQKASDQVETHEDSHRE